MYICMYICVYINIIFYVMLIWLWCPTKSVFLFFEWFWIRSPKYTERIVDKKKKNKKRQKKKTKKKLK